MPSNVFSPAVAGTVNATFDNTGTIRATVTGSGDVLRVVNAGTATAFVNISPSVTITAAAATATPVLVSTNIGAEFLAIPTTGTVYVAGVTASGSTTVYFSRGSKI